VEHLHFGTAVLELRLGFNRFPLPSNEALLEQASSCFHVQNKSLSYNLLAVEFLLNLLLMIFLQGDASLAAID